MNPKKHLVFSGSRPENKSAHLVNWQLSPLVAHTPPPEILEPQENTPKNTEKIPQNGHCFGILGVFFFGIFGVF